MKRSQKTLLVIVALALVALFTLVGCGGSSDPMAGTWNLSGAKVAGVEMTADQLQAVQPDLDMTLECNDGKLTLTSSLFSGTREGTYTVNGETVTIESDGQSMEATLKDGRLTIEIGGVELYLEK